MGVCRPLLVAALFSCASAAQSASRPALTTRHSCVVCNRLELLAAAKPPEPTPAAKLLDVSRSAAAETLILLIFLRLVAVVIARVSNDTARFWIGQLAWLAVVQGSSQIQGYVQSNTATLNEEWYAALTQPSWNPPAWVFPAMWIPIKLAQTVGGAVAWRALDHKVFAAPIVVFLLHLSLGDTWNVQFFLMQRLLTGLIVIYVFWAVLIAATVLLGLTAPAAGALVAPGIAWIAVAAALNLDVWYLNKK